MRRKQRSISDFFSAPPPTCAPAKQPSSALLAATTLPTSSGRSRKRLSLPSGPLRKSQSLSTKRRRLQNALFPAHLGRERALTNANDKSGDRRLSQSAPSHAIGDRKKTPLPKDRSQEHQQPHERFPSSNSSRDLVSSVRPKKKQAQTPARFPSPAYSIKDRCITKFEPRDKQASRFAKSRDAYPNAKSLSDQKMPLKKREGETIDYDDNKDTLIKTLAEPVKTEVKREASSNDAFCDRKPIPAKKSAVAPKAGERKACKFSTLEDDPMENIPPQLMSSGAENERKSRKETSGTDGEAGIPPLPYRTSSETSESSSDSSLSGNSPEAGESGWRAEAKSVMLRRSTRILKGVDRYKPSGDLSVSQGLKDVFGDILSKVKSTGVTVSSKTVRSIVKECQQVEKREAENNALRQNMEATANIVGDDEQGFKSLADIEQRQQDQEKVALTKYSSPLHIFNRPVSVPEPKLALKCDDDGSSIDNWRSLLTAFINFQEKATVSASMLASIMSKEIDTTGKVWRFQIGSVLLSLCVFDKTVDTLGGRCYNDLLDVFLKLVRSDGMSMHQDGETSIPSLLFVLQAYGAAVNPNGVQITEDHENGNCQRESLDAISSRPHVERTPSEAEQLAIGLRNVKRAFRAAAAQLERGWGWRRAIGFRTQNDKHGIIQTVILCSKVLCSPFGSRLKREVGQVIKAALMRCQAGQWPSLRWEISKAIVTMTTRLQLHVELVSYLFPFDCERSLNCSLDIAYLSLVQWARGPSTEPLAQDVSDHAVSDFAKDFGLDSISFCVEDILVLLGDIPELAKDTDIVWGCGVARLLKQILTMPLVVARRKPGQLGVLNQTINKLRHCTHRLRYDVAVQEMRMALDALIRVLRFMGSADKKSRKELYPNAREELKQTKL